MKLNELKGILYSRRDGVQMTIVYEQETGRDIETGCSVEYAIKNYGDKEVKHIQAENNYLVITI